MAVKEIAMANEQDLPEWYDEGLHALQLPPQVEAMLEKAGIVTIGKLCEHTPQAIVQFPRSGVTSLKHIYTALQRYGLIENIPSRFPVKKKKKYAK